MASRSKAAAKGRRNDEQDGSPSQQSTSSDDSQMAQMVADLKATLGKKNRDKEKKIVESVKGGLQNIIGIATTRFQKTCEQSHDVNYSKFLLDYAACDDRLRQIWTEISKEQANLIKIAEQSTAESLALVKTQEDRQFAGLGRIEASLTSQEEIITALEAEYTHD